MALARYPEVKRIHHVHHAGNSSGIVDGVAAVLVGSEAAGKLHGLTPRARTAAVAVSGADPTIMLTGPVPASRKALAKACLTIDQIDLFEVNEAFTAVPLRFMKESSAAYTDLIHKLGGAAMFGLYATHTVQHPYLDEASQPIRFWANKYKTKFNEDPTMFSVYGYSLIDTFAKAAQKAGTNLSTDTFIKAMESMTIEPDMFGSPAMTFSATKRLGNDLSRLSQITDGKWKVMAAYAKRWAFVAADSRP